MLKTGPKNGRLPPACLESSFPGVLWDQGSDATLEGDPADASELFWGLEGRKSGENRCEGGGDPCASPGLVTSLS